MSGRTELVSPEACDDAGLRVDGRRPLELRRLLARVGVFSQADGSAYIELGNTKCIAAVYGPKEPRSSTASHSTTATNAILNVEYAVASFSSSSTSTRSRSQRTSDRRHLEIASLIKHTLEPIIIATTFSSSEIDIFIQVLQVDGGVLHAAINAACLALVDAGIPLSDWVVACSAGWTNQGDAGGEPILDLNWIEEGGDMPVMTVALLPKSGKLSLMESRLHMDHMQQVLDLAMDGCTTLAEAFDKTVREACVAPRPI
eukprot:jgi/Hompol1/3185/HPOL_003138-RA